LRTAAVMDDAERAFAFMEKAKAALLRDASNNNIAKEYLPRKAADKERDFRERIAVVEQEIMEQGATDVLLKKRKFLKREQENFVKSLEQNYPAYFQFKYDTEVLRVGDVMEGLLTDSTTLVEYFVGEELIYALTISGCNTVLHELGKPDNFGEMVSDFVNGMNNRVARKHKGYEDAAFDLYCLLVEPLELEDRKLIVIKDDILHYMPFDALMDDGQDSGAFLLEDYMVSYAYSAKVLHNNKDTERTPDRDFLFVAPVEFEDHNPLADGEVLAVSRYPTQPSRYL